MAKAKQKDLYVNRSFAEVTMSGVDTLTFQQINFAVGTFQGVALKLIRLMYYPTGATLDQIVASTDSLYMGVTLRNDLTDISPTNQSIIDLKAINGVGTNVEPLYVPFVTDFSTLPQGGVLIPANPLYITLLSAGFASAGIMRVVLYYTFVELTDRESVELLQTIIPGNV